MTTVDPNLSLAPAKSPWRWLWQIPLLLIGLGVFALGTRQLVRIVKPVPFDIHVADIQSLLTTKKYDLAIKQINTLADYYAADAPKQGRLHVLAGDAHYLANQDGAFARENYRKAIEHYDKAERYSIKPTPLTLERWGLSALALKDSKVAVEKLELLTLEDPGKLHVYGRSLIDAYVAAGQSSKALAILERLLEHQDSDLDDRTWALCKRIELTMNSGGVGLDHAIKEAQKALEKTPERNPAGLLLAWIGRAEFERGNIDAAAKYLADARSRFVVHHVDDGRVALLLAKIAQARGQHDEAQKLYHEIATTHKGESIWAAARFGRAEVAAQLNTPSEQMLADYRHAVQTVLGETDHEKNVKPEKRSEMLDISQVRASLITQYQRYAQAGKLEDALRFLELQVDLKEPETPATAFRLATTKERLAREELETLSQLPASETEKRDALRDVANKLLASAAEDYRRHAKLTTLTDEVSGNSLWRSAQLFDDCGQSAKAIDVFEQFIAQRPRDPRVPEALLAVGQLYQAQGKVALAIPYYLRNIKEHAKTPAAYSSAVYLAQCYMLLASMPTIPSSANPQENATIAENFSKAEAALLSIVQDNPDLTPVAREFRISLFTLGELYYRNRKWSDAILRLQEAITRYPDDRMIPRATYMLAESYRRSAQDIAAVIKQDPAIERRDALEKARTDRLRAAATLFAQVIALLDLDPADPKPLARIDEDYLRIAYMSRAECYYDLGDYSTAVKLYDQTAIRFAQSITAVEAYVQVINSYFAMKEPRQAAAAAERARWILKRIPDEEFGKGPLALTRQYYEDFLTLSRTP